MPQRKGPSKNIARLSEDLKRVLIDIIASMKDPRLAGGLITVTRVETAQDLTLAKVYVSVMATAKGAPPTQDVLGALRAARGHVRSAVAARMHIRRAPELHFIEDDGAAYAAHINELLKDLSK